MVEQPSNGRFSRAPLTNYIPLVLFVMGIAASAGVLYNNVGRISILEAELAQRTNVLPAEVTSKTIDKMSTAIDDLKSRALTVAADNANQRREIQSLQDLASEGVRKYTDTVRMLAQAEAQILDIQERAKRVRDDLNEHRKEDLELLRDRLRAAQTTAH